VSVFPGSDALKAKLTHRKSRIDRLYARKDGRKAARFREADQAELVNGTTKTYTQEEAPKLIRVVIELYMHVSLWPVYGVSKHTTTPHPNHPPTSVNISQLNCPASSLSKKTFPNLTHCSYAALNPSSPP
jgi:hypothetical protein